MLMDRVAALAVLAVALGAPAALAAETSGTPGAERVGAAAYGDWRTSAPGVVRLIRPSDLPAPYATPSARSGPSLVARPAGAPPQVPPGFTVSALVTGLDIPRQMHLAPNGDIFLAESGANRIRVIRARTTSPSVFADHLRYRPYGIAFWPPGPEPRYVYIATEGQVLRFAYDVGDLKAAGAPEIIVPDVPVGHHWTRDIVFTPDGSQAAAGGRLRRQ